MISVSRFYRDYGKRIFDFSASFFGLTVLSIPLSATGIAVLLTSGRPVFFKQKRVGKNGKIFELIKFRTMEVGAESGGPVTVLGDKRITRIGKILRQYKLDEFPQLINVLKGEMSFVGPRPDVPGYADFLTGEERKILELLPGITGPATLAFRNEEEILAKQEDPVRYNDEVIFREKVRLNLRYFEECSFSKDIEYILKTIFLR